MRDSGFVLGAPVEDELNWERRMPVEVQAWSQADIRVRMRCVRRVKLPVWNRVQVGVQVREWLYEVWL